MREGACVAFKVDGGTSKQLGATSKAPETRMSPRSLVDARFKRAGVDQTLLHEVLLNGDGRLEH